LLGRLTLLFLPMGDDWREAFAEQWDAVVLGTGMKECLLSGLLSVAGKRVLHLDRNDYYGGASASLDIHQLFQKFGQGTPDQAELGKLRDYSIDLVPKFIMAGGKLVQVLIHTGVHNYMEFQKVDGSFVYSSKAGKVCKVPASPEDGLKTSLMGMMEKTRFVQFALWVSKVKLGDRSTWKAGTMTKKDLPLDTMTGAQFFAYWALEKTTIEVVTHAFALFRDDASWKDSPAIHIVKRMQLYLDSRMRFGMAPTPYVYPLYGLGELPQSFARLAAVHGGTYMLNRTMDDSGPVFGEGKFDIVYGEDSAATGVKVKDTVANAKVVVADPSYFPEMCSLKGKVVRAIAIVNEPLPNTGTPPASSYQIIFPGASVGRVNDIYLFCGSSSLKVAPEGKYLVFVSTNVEGPTDGMSAEAVAQRELTAGLSMLKGVVRVFYDMYDMMVPNSTGEKDGIFLTQSFDPTTHFETAITDVLNVYERITGKALDLSANEGASSS